MKATEEGENWRMVTTKTGAKEISEVEQSTSYPIINQLSHWNLQNLVVDIRVLAGSGCYFFSTFFFFFFLIS